MPSQEAGGALTAIRAATRMSNPIYLTPEEAQERYRGAVSVDTLRNWRSMRIGPSFVKFGKAVLYPAAELDLWDQKNMVACETNRLTRSDRDDR